MEHKGYFGRVEFDDDEGLLHGEILGIRDVVTFQGESVDEVRQAFKDSVDEYLAWCAELGRAPERPCSGRFVVRVEPDLHRRLVAVAQAKGKSLNALVAKTLEDAVEDGR